MLSTLRNGLISGLFLLSSLLLTSCSNGGGFHLRDSVALPEVYKRVYMQGKDLDSRFGEALQRAFEAAGSELVDDVSKATMILKIEDYDEGKKVAGYGTNREVREYLIFLRFIYSTRSKDGKELLKPRKVNLDKIQIYDSAFVLGKIEEARLIKKDLRENAARQIVLRLRYAE